MGGLAVPGTWEGLMDNKEQRAADYWRANVRLMVISLIIWALVSFGFGILLRPMQARVLGGGGQELARGGPAAGRR